jgi:uncharacterized damage-inducible protein DinB
MFALYNCWANKRLFVCAAQLTPEALAENRRAFFRSLLGTLNHLLVTDGIWMSRLEGISPRGTTLDELQHENLDGLATARYALDQRILEFVFGLNEDRLAESLNYASTVGVPHSQPLYQVLSHLFNHQTHHRGQAHHVIGLAIGRDKAPVLDLLAYQRSVTSMDQP